MAMQPSVRFISLIWCVLECLLISGMLNGWIFMKEILRDEDYFTGGCNWSIHSRKTGLDDLNPRTLVLEDSVMGFGIDVNKPITKTRKGKEMQCFYKRVLKTLSFSEYEILLNESKSYYHNSSTATIRKAEKRMCDEQNVYLETIISCVHIARNILMLPIGMLMDNFGTIRFRIISL